MTRDTNDVGSGDTNHTDWSTLPIWIVAAGNAPDDHVPPAPKTLLPNHERETAQQPHGGHRNARRWRLALVGLTVLAIAAVSLLLVLPVPPANPASNGIVTVSPAAAQVRCVQDAAWSSDGRRVAVLGYTSGCPPLASSAASATGAVVVYDAATGAMRARFQPDTAILAAVSHTEGFTHPTIAYQSLLWRHDGARLAISFLLARDNPPDLAGAGQGDTITGIFLSAADGTHPAVFTHLLAPGERAAGEWNLRTGAYIPAVAGLPQPALSYTWDAAGALVPRDPLALDATPPASVSAAIGDPNGGAGFSIWQPAQIVRESASGASGASGASDTSGSATDGVYVYRTSFAAWSADGTFFAPSLGLSARLQPAGQPVPRAQTLRALGVAGLPLLPVRDAGLARALGRLALLPRDQSNGPMVVAWSPNGRMLAVQLVPAEPNAEPQQTDHALMVYDCATGKPLTTLVPAGVAPGKAAPLTGATLLRWSADGAHLLLYDAALGTVTIWGPGKVPRG